jgi:putative ABC transport system ATP-binding protein
LNIIILEDDTALSSGVALALAADERRFTLCHTIGEARTARQDGSPDLFIPDIKLPDGSGLDFCAELRAAGCVAPVLMLTANDTEVAFYLSDRKEALMYVLKTSNLKKYYGTGAAGGVVVKAIDGVDLAVEAGEFVSVVGSSGSGKSTLLHLLGGLDRPTEGVVEVGGKAIFSMKDDELTIFRRRNIGFVFQSYNLVPVLNVEENILLPIELDGDKPDAAYIDRVIETLGLSEKRTSMPNELSGGQQQRAAIARALAGKPAILLADEPTGNLDSKASMDVMGLLKVSGERFGQTIVLITHNAEIAQLADRSVRIEDGRIAGGTAR